MLKMALSPPLYIWANKKKLKKLEGLGCKFDLDQMGSIKLKWVGLIIVKPTNRKP